MHKIFQLAIPTFVKKWLTNFLILQEQCLRLSRECYSECRVIPARVPQGTKLGPWLFILLINDLRPASINRWKNIDDTTVSQIIPKNSWGYLQLMTNDVLNWSININLHLNEHKCKELLIYLGKSTNFSPQITLNRKELQVVTHTKVLSLTIRNDLKWNKHVNNMIKKANKH